MIIYVNSIKKRFKVFESINNINYIVKIDILDCVNCFINGKIKILIKICKRYLWSIVNLRGLRLKNGK